MKQYLIGRRTQVLKKKEEGKVIINSLSVIYDFEEKKKAF